MSSPNSSTSGRDRTDVTPVGELNDDEQDELLSLAVFADWAAQKRREFIDPFSGSVFNDPVTAEDGQVYERKHLMRWFRELSEQGKQVISPGSSRQPMGRSITPANALTAQINHAREQHQQHSWYRGAKNAMARPASGEKLTGR